MATESFEEVFASDEVGVPADRRTHFRHSGHQATRRDLTAAEFAELLAEASEGDRVPTPRPTPATWDRSELDAEGVVELIGGLPFRGNDDHQRRRRRAARTLLTWLAQFEGATWQERWINGGLEDAQRTWVGQVLATYPDLGSRSVRSLTCEIHTGMMALLAGQIIRPAYRWLLAQHFNFTLIQTRRMIDPDGFARMEAHCDKTDRTGQCRTGAMNCVAMILLNKGGYVADITVDDCVDFAAAMRVSHRAARHVTLFYSLLFEMGILGDDAPPTLAAARAPGQRTVQQMVDSYRIVSPRVRELLIAYLTIRKPELDYASLRGLASTLCLTYWRDLEKHHPGIDSIDLAPEVAAAWKHRLKTIRESKQRKGQKREKPERVMLAVRAFYLDLAQWAVTDPARWGPWGVPCPIRANECVGTKRERASKARMHQRTRQRAPVLPTLVATAERLKKEAVARVEAARAVAPREGFTIGGETFIRGGGDIAKTTFVFDTETGRRRNFGLEEDEAFWGWAIVEVLRHTGIRVEELMELTHHSFVAYTLPSTGEVVPMLQIAPSKTDRERLILVSPELGDVLTAIIHRVRNGKAVLPLVSRYDHHEHVHSPLLPFLFQRRIYMRDSATNRNFVARCIDNILLASGLTDASGEPLRFTPHDFRRIFATDAIRTGLPPHIAAKILGHTNVNTTMRYAAIYSDDVIAHHRAFIARRRSLRPGAEYRDLTPEEWQEFLGHFELRKLELGVCTRDFGSPCVHEHACIRCPALRPDPAQAPRLREIIANLHARVDEAKQQGWLGEIAGLEVSLAAANDKLAAMNRLTERHGPVHLGMPDFRPATGLQG
ncbi:tyrosine-type recombinase/integrase [Streptomyces celluloflavus]|uniref:tyrosine-type recombinase/integrase n=1 Tax=Streptomyces celluloflavus TaxID=58344 RepID=UPI00367A2E45